jgi:hypothetical protein
MLHVHIFCVETGYHDFFLDGYKDEEEEEEEKGG